MATGFVSVPIVPTFRGMSKEFSERLEKPARQSGERAGKAISGELAGAVQSLEKQVKASSAKLEPLERAQEKAHGKQKVRQIEAEEATRLLTRAEEAYKKALAEGKGGDAEYRKLSAAKIKDAKATNDLRDAEAEATVARKKHQDQLKDLERTTEKHEKAQADLNAEAGKSQGVFERFRGELGKTQVEIDSTAEKTLSLGDKVMMGFKKVGTGALLGVGARIGTGVMDGIDTAFSKGFGRLESLEQSEASLLGLGRTAEDIESIMASVNQAVSGTAFGLDEASTSAATFSTLGVKSGKEMDRVMTLLSDTTAQANSSLGEMSPIMGNIVAAGGLTTETFDQLNNRATGVGEALSKHLGVPIEEVRDLAKEVDFETFATAMEANIGGAAQKSGETFGNSLGNMQAALGRLGQKFLEPAFKLGPQVFGAIGGSVDKLGEHLGPLIEDFSEKLNPYVKDFAENLGPRLEGTIDSAAAVVKDLVGWGKQAVEWLKENRVWMETAAVSATVLAGGIALMNLQNKIAVAGGFLKWIQTWTSVTKLQTGAQAALNFALRMNPIGLVITAVAALAGGLVYLASKTEWGQEIWSRFTGAVSDGWDQVVGKFEYGIELIQTAWKELTEAFSGGDWGYGALAEIIGLDAAEWVVNAVGSVKDAWEELTTAFTGGDWGYGALSAILGEDNAEFLINVIADIGERFRVFRDDAVALFQDVKAIAEPVLSWLYEFAKDQLGESLGSLWESLQDVGGAFFEVASTVGGALWDALMGVYDLFIALWDFLSPVLLPLLKIVGGIIGGVLVGAFMGLIGAIRLASEIIEILASVISWVMETILVPLVSLVGAVASIFAETLAGAVTSLKDRFIESFQIVGGIWDGFMSLLEVGKDVLIATVFGGIGAGLTVLKDNFSTVVDAIGKIWGGIIKLTAQPAKFVVETVYGGIRSAWNKVANWVDLPELPEVKLGDLGNYAEGTSFVPGPRSVGRDNMAFFTPDGRYSIALAGGEGIARQEFVDAIGPHNFDALNQAAVRGGRAGVDATLEHMHFGGFSQGGIIDSMMGFVDKHFPGLSMTSGWRFTDTGMHSRGQAADFSNQVSGGPSTPESRALARAIYTNFPNQTEQLIHWQEDGWKNLLSGAPFNYGAATNAQHTDHVHWGLLNPLNYDADELDLSGGGGGGIFQSITSLAKKAWDGIINALPSFDGDGPIGEMPGAVLGKMGGAAWDYIKSLADKLLSPITGGGGADQWSGLASQALSIWGYGTEYLDAMLQQIQIESTGDPNAVNMWDSNAVAGTPSAGLLQVIEPTYQDVRRRYPERFEGLPDDRMHPLTNLVAGIGALERDWGGPAGGRWPTRGGYAEGTSHLHIPDLLTRDLGGWVPDGALVRNTSGRDELMLPPELSQAMAGFFSDYPEAAEMLAVAAGHIESAAEFLSKAADGQSEEGIVARASMRRILDLGIDLPGSMTVTAFMDAEEVMWASRERHLGHLDSLVEKEQALEKARKALEELESSEGGLGTKDQRKLDDAKAAVEEAKANVAKADSEEKRSKATEKLADTEEKLSRVREDLAESAEQDAEKRAENITKANDEVMKAEQALVDAKKQQVADLDHMIVLSQESIGGMQSQAVGFADQLIGMGAPAGMVSQGLGAVTGALSSVAGMAGPAGMSLGMLFDLVKTTISLVTTIVEAIGDILDMIHEARQAALQALGDGFRTIAEYGTLISEMQHNVSTLQQDIVRGLNEQRVAEFALRVAQHDRLVAEAAGIVSVAEARLALDREIERGNIAAQLRLMGLHEDWDSYLSFQALASQGMLDQWSDAAIGALFTYEAARAKALQAELSARLDQINAEAQLAAITRQNTRANIELLKAQERLIMLSAEANGIDLVGATASSQIVDLMVEINDLQKSNDSNLAGKATHAADWLVGWIPGVDVSSPWSKEMEGNQQRIDANRALIKELAAEYDINLSDSQVNNMLKDMAAVSATGGDPTAIIRKHIPEFAAAEDLLRKDQAYRPIWDAVDASDRQDWGIEDLLAGNDLFEQTNPLQETIKGLDYTIAGLEDAASAWAEGNEDLRSEYLGSAWANYQAGKDLGANWELDGNYATPGVRDQIVKEVHIHLDGADMYTADQVDQLVQEAMSGTNAKPVVHINASTVAKSKRGVMA